jgi:ribonuclease HIII
MILSNKDYNEYHSNDLNMNKIKAILHNKVLGKLSNQINDYEYIIVDQFAEPYVYFNYLKNSSNVVRNITFFTKGEDKHLAVACASLISRYIFINEFNKLSKSLNLDLPKGASNLVDEIGVKIVKEYGIDKLNEIAKLNFKNTDKIKENLN